MAVNPLGISAAIADFIDDISGFDVGNVVDLGASGNVGHAILDEGYKQVAIVVPPFEFRRQVNESMGFRELDARWEVPIEVYYIVGHDEGTSYRGLVQAVAAIIDKLDVHEMLGKLSGIVDATVVSGGPVFEIYDKDGNGPFYLMSVLTMSVLENVSVAFEG